MHQPNIATSCSANVSMSDSFILEQALEHGAERLFKSFLARNKRVDASGVRDCGLAG